jgi:hypothetical protein
VWGEREAEAQACGRGVKRVSLAAVEVKQTRLDTNNEPLPTSDSTLCLGVHPYGVLNSVRHDTSQLMVVSAVIDGRRCKDVLIDPGASSNFVRQDWVSEVRLPTKSLTTPLDVMLADGKVGVTT